MIEARTRIVLFVQKTIYFATQSIYEVSATLFRISVFNISPSLHHFSFFPVDLASKLPCHFVVDPEFKLPFFYFVPFSIVHVRNQDFYSAHTRTSHRHIKSKPPSTTRQLCV